jgi:hypothetical protein
MERAVVIYMRDARLILEVLKNEKITAEFDIDTVINIGRVRADLEEKLTREDVRARTFREREAVT